MLNWASKKEGRMARQKHTVEQIISKLRQAEVELSQGRTRGEVCRSLGVTEQTYYRWRKEYGGLQMDQAKRWKEVEQENTRLRKAVAELTLDKLILKEAARGKLLSRRDGDSVLRECARHGAFPNAGCWGKHDRPS